VWQIHMKNPTHAYFILFATFDDLEHLTILSHSKVDRLHFRKTHLVL